MSAYQAEEEARVVIDRNQSLINDPNRDDKGFTPEVFEQQVIGDFRIRTGVDLTKPALLRRFSLI